MPWGRQPFFCTFGIHLDVIVGGRRVIKTNETTKIRISEKNISQNRVANQGDNHGCLQPGGERGGGGPCPLPSPGAVGHIMNTPPRVSGHGGGYRMQACDAGWELNFSDCWPTWGRRTKTSNSSSNISPMFVKSQQTPAKT